MKEGAYLINTSRGALIQSEDLIESIKAKHLAGAALDVYEEEENLFFRDMSDEIIPDDRFSILNSLPNVLITSHQAFLTYEAYAHIVQTTLRNASSWSTEKSLLNAV